MEVSIVMGVPHLWMVYVRENKSMDDLGVPPFMETTKSHRIQIAKVNGVEERLG